VSPLQQSEIFKGFQKVQEDSIKFVPVLWQLLLPKRTQNNPETLENNAQKRSKTL
jgi:hypothetical protein